jgi:hypothetical protein
VDLWTGLWIGLWIGLAIGLSFDSKVYNNSVVKYDEY